MKLQKPTCATCVHWNSAPGMVAKLNDGAEMQMGACSGEPPKVLLVPTNPPQSAMIQATARNQNVMALEPQNFRPITAAVEPACRHHQEMIYLLEMYADVRVEHNADAAMYAAFADPTSEEQAS